MSVNLSKNNDTLVAAWASVVDDKSSVNWAVFGYEGQTNNLKVVGTGNGGLEEMIEDLNSGEIMYAFCRVIDTNTTLPKCVLVNWQGEGAPIVRKATCANHIRDIERLLKGAHIQINARSEEDVEVDMIMEKLARATGSAYEFKQPRGRDVGNSGPVGTVYKRVNPEQEINATERDQFWQREEMEEKARVEQEKIRREKERQKLELETRSREEKQSQMREQAAAIPPPNIREAKSEQRVQELKNLRNQQAKLTNGSDSEEDPKSKSDELRRQRSNEAQQLIGLRTINARAVFEQNSAAGQMKAYSPAPKAAPATPKTAPVISKIIPAAPICVSVAPEEPVAVEKAPEPEKPVLSKPEPIIETPAPREPTPEPQKVEINVPKVKEPEQTPQEINNDEENEIYNQLSGDNYLYFDPTNEGMKARALYDYQAADDTEITFDPGDIITHIDAIDEGWWQGLGPDGTYGLFPANYVEVIENTNS